jgi:hypothetical protein
MSTVGGKSRISLDFHLEPGRWVLLGGPVLLLLVGALVAGCGGGGASRVLPSVKTGQSFILAEVRADSTQALLPGATLTVAGNAATGDGTGKFKLTVAPGVSYQLTAAAAGYAPQTRTVQVPSAAGLASSVTQVILYLPAALPTITLDPAGGQIDAGNGIIVQVPAGAVAVRITATLTVNSLTAAGGSLASTTGSSLASVLGSVDLLPAGTSFASPVKIIVPRAFLKIVDALVTPGSTFELWESGAAAGQFVLSSGKAEYKAGDDIFLLTLPHMGSYQLRPGVTLQPVGNLSRDLGTLTSTTGGSIPEGAATYNYSTSSSSSDPGLNAILTGTYGVAPDVNLSTTNPPVAGQEGFIIDVTAKQTGQRVNVSVGGTSLGTVDYYGTQVVMAAAVRPPPRTGTG